MKVLFIIDKLDCGGVETIVTGLALEFVAQGHCVDILTPHRVTSDNTQRLVKSGVTILQSRYPQRLNPLNLLSYYRAIRRGKYDIVHVHHLRQQLMVSIVSLFVRARYVTTEHGTYNKKQNYGILRYLDRFIYSRFRRVVAVSAAVKESLLGWLRVRDTSKYCIIHNGVDVHQIRGIGAIPSTEFGFGDNDIIISSVGRLAVGKDFETIIKALRELDSRYKLVIVGDGPERPNIEQQIRDNGVEDRVFMYGYSSSVCSVLKATDIYVASSMFEGFGLTLIEAMACSLPVVYNNIPPFVEVMGDSSPQIFQTQDSEELARIILGLVGDTANYSRAVEFSRTRSAEFDIKNICTQTLSMYQSIQKQGNG